MQLNEAKPENSALVVLGGGITPEGKPTRWTEKRLQKALSTISENELIIVTTRIAFNYVPPVDQYGFPMDESIVMADYLVGHGIDPKRILIENSSYDTIGNLFYLRTVHTDPRGLNQLRFITSEFHTQRSKIIANWIFSLTPVSQDYQIEFIVADDYFATPEIRQQRKEKEENSIENLKNIMAGIDTLKEFHKWIFSEHNAYKAGHKQIPLPPDRLKIINHKI